MTLFPSVLIFVMLDGHLDFPLHTVVLEDPSKLWGIMVCGHHAKGHGHHHARGSIFITTFLHDYDHHGAVFL